MKNQCELFWRKSINIYLYESIFMYFFECELEMTWFEGKGGLECIGREEEDLKTYYGVLRHMGITN